MHFPQLLLGADSCSSALLPGKKFEELEAESRIDGAQTCSAGFVPKVTVMVELDQL